MLSRDHGQAKDAGFLEAAIICVGVGTNFTLSYYDNVSAVCFVN